MVFNLQSNVSVEPALAITARSIATPPGVIACQNKEEKHTISQIGKGEMLCLCSVLSIFQENKNDDDAAHCGHLCT